MSANNKNNNNNENELRNSMSNIDDQKCSDNSAPKIQVIPSDNTSLKSETSSVCRPLRFDGTGTHETTDQNNENQINNVYNACEVQNDGTIGSRSSRLGTLIQCKSDSTEEKTVCCANLAINLYNKALESAKRALPQKSKERRAHFPRSFGEDFESIGPEGFNYLDDGQTECSYDYRDIEFNRDSMFRPDILAQTGDLPLLLSDTLEEPTNLNELQSRYGLPEEADRVQPYKPQPIIVEQNPNPKPINPIKNIKRTELKTEVAINKDSELTTHTSDTTTNAIEEGIIVKNRCEYTESPSKLPQTIIATSDPMPSTSVTPVEPEPIPGPSNINTTELNTTPTNIIMDSEPQNIEIRKSSLSGPSDRLSAMDLLAKRTSQLIIETALESIAKSNAEDLQKTDKRSKKSSTESNAKELKKEKKLLEKKLKEEEKSRKKIEKESKNLERKERKKLFDRFRSEDKQKRKIQKKQKEFEKIKRKLSEHKSKDSAAVSDAEADIEADDEYEPSSDRIKDRAYEDIDDTHSKHETKPVMDLSKPNEGLPKPSSEEVVKIEVIDNIREIGVTYVPTDDGIENENYIEENDGKPKSKSSSFRIPRIESFKSKVIGIFPKKTPKSSDKIDKKSEQKPEGVNIGEGSTAVPEIVVNPSEDQLKTHEYENIEESNIEPKVNPLVPNSEQMANQWETDEEDRLQFIERISRVESPKIGAKKRKKSKTRAKLDRFKAKAIESLPKMSSIVPKVKGLVGVGKREDSAPYRDMDYERFISDHTSGRHRYDSDFDCVSDSELCDSLRRTGGVSGGLGKHHVYEEMAATQERLDAYMSPVSGPLRPPRRFSSLKNVQKVASVPTLSTQVLLRPKRIPPPRPPPPRPPAPKAPMVIITVESSAKQDSLKRRPKQRVPPEIYYNNLRMNFKPKRRFINLKSKHLEALATYDEPKPPLPVFSVHQKPTVRAMRAETLHRVNQKNALNTVLNQSFGGNTMPLKERNDLIINDQKVVHTVGPTPPPRRKRKAQRSQTIDPLDWRPFTWKTRRCRSLTELDVRKPKDFRVRRSQNYENIPPKPSGGRPRTPRPARPPLPTLYYSSISLHSSKRYPSEYYHIYSSISRKGHHNVGRPLPPPPVPPRPKYILAKPVPSKPVASKPVPKTRDVCVSTKDNGLFELCEKQTQIDARNQSICEDFNGNELELDSERTPTNPLTPTTPTNQTKVVFPQTKYIINEDSNRDLEQQCVGLNESTVTLSSITTTNWFDAENPSEVEAHPYKDYDQDTLNDDISSIASVYQSFSSDVTVTESREETPVPEDDVIDDIKIVDHHNKRNAPKPAVRSQSTKIVSDISNPCERSVTRRSLPSNVEEPEDNVERFGMSRELHSELQNILEKRASDISSERPDSIASSEASQQEIIMTNIESNSSVEGNMSYLWSSTQPISHSSSVDSLDSQPIDSSSDGDDYSLSSANQESEEFLKRKQLQKLFFIAKELYSSEEVFIDVLRLLNCDFRVAVEQHIPEEVLNSILRLLPQLLQINEQLLTDLKTRIDDWPNHQRISDVLVKICPFLKQYSLYIRDFETISATYDEALRRYPSFASAVKHFESTPRCQKLSVKHFMLKPVQRIPQYRLLLDDYLKHLNPESEDYLDTCSALQIVSQVAEHANNSMKSNENISKLLSIQNSIIGGTEIIKPGRLFIKEGELMKLSRKGMQERWFILFNDCLMYLTAVQNGVFRVNHELSLTGMRVSLPPQQDFQNEFSVISHTRSFSLAARSTKEREEWVKALNKAIEENINKRISFAKSGSLCGDESELSLGNCAPVWIPDARVTMCQLCTETFSVTFRRHHCRCCGKVVCSACSQNKAPLPYLKNRTARVCDECFDKLTLQLQKLDSLSTQMSASSTEVGASASDTDEGWSIKEWKQQFARNLIRKSNRKSKHKYVPSVLKEVSANDVGSLISGYLHKRDGKRNWKRYWFVIKDLVLYTYKASEDVAALKSLPLLGFKVETLRESVDGIDQKSLFQLTHPGQPSLMFRAETIGSAERWFKAMETATTLE